MWQTLLLSCFCSYEHFFLIRALFRKQMQFENKSTSLGFGCFGVSALRCQGPHSPCSGGRGRKPLQLCCSGNKRVFSGSLINLHMFGAFWHFGASLQPATSSAISRNSSAISRNRAQFQKVSAGPLSRRQKHAKISRCAKMNMCCPLCTHVTY